MALLRGLLELAPGQGAATENGLNSAPGQAAAPPLPPVLGAGREGDGLVEEDGQTKGRGASSAAAGSGSSAAPLLPSLLLERVLRG